MADVIRIKVEPNIWFRVTDKGDQERDGERGLYEITFKDVEGHDRRRKVEGGILAARKALREEQARRDRGGRVTTNARLRFGEAAQKWLDGPMALKRSQTRKLNEQMVRLHLAPRFGNRRLDSITPDDAAELVRAMRVEGYAESTITHALGALSRVFKLAQRRLGGPPNPVAELLTEERPQVRRTRHTIYEGGQLAQTIAAAQQPYRMLFQLNAVIGARMGEAVGLHWHDLDGVASIRGQVGRDGVYVEHGKTATSLRDVPLPAGL